MTNLTESPPYMPLDERTREIWAILLEVCPDLDNIRITSHKPMESITIVGDYYGEPIEKTIDISWAFRPMAVALPLVKKVFDER